jgi:hypothetical protein
MEPSMLNTDENQANVPAPEAATAASAKTPVTKKPRAKAAAVKAVAPKAAARKAAAPKVAAPKAAAAKPAAAKAVQPKPAAAPAAAKPAKVKLVRDSFTIPAAEYAVLAELKQRALANAHPAKKSELLRAGIKLLASLSDKALLTVLQDIPAIKTGRPGKKG